MDKEYREGDRENASRGKRSLRPYSRGTVTTGERPLRHLSRASSRRVSP